MAGNTRYIYDADERSMLKVVGEPDSVRVKICPADPESPGEFVENGRPWPGSDQAAGPQPVEAMLTRRALNRLITDLRDMRDRAWGADA